MVVQKHVQDFNSRALFTDNHNHALNVVIVHGCSDIQLQEKKIAAIPEKASVKRKHNLQKQCSLDDSDGENNRSQGFL